MDVVIVSKTRMSKAICVGGVLANGKFVRLLDSNGYNQSIDTELNIGDVYTITFEERQQRRPPHTEDILIFSKIYKFSFESVERMVFYLKNKLNINIWKGNIDSVFEGKLQWTNGNNGSGYVSGLGKIPNQSTGFWILDHNLIRNDFNDKIRYKYQFLSPSSNNEIDLIRKSLQTKYIPYVGLQEPLTIIEKGTLVRLSLARWWSPNNDEERCYLQLSGWY